MSVCQLTMKASLTPETSRYGVTTNSMKSLVVLSLVVWEEGGVRHSREIVLGAQGMHPCPASALQAAAGEFWLPSLCHLLDREQQGDRVVLELNVRRLGTGHLDLPHHEPGRPGRGRRS